MRTAVWRVHLVIVLGHVIGLSSGSEVILILATPTDGLLMGNRRTADLGLQQSGEYPTFDTIDNNKILRNCLPNTVEVTFYARTVILQALPITVILQALSITVILQTVFAHHL